MVLRLVNVRDYGDLRRIYEGKMYPEIRIVYTADFSTGNQTLAMLKLTISLSLIDIDAVRKETLGL